MKRNLFSLLALLLMMPVAAQFKWYNPMEAGFPVLQNQAWPGEERENPYNRIPLRAKDNLRKAVWSLSHHAAGECIVFTTNAKEIQVRYTVSGGKYMYHMPATGVSGVDLYTKSRNGEELWLAASYSMGDTIKYHYGRRESALDYDYNTKHAHTYTLYLPLYNEVKWMEIGVAEGDEFRFEPLRAERPIVVYGTSIAHGACASRPGMAWTNIIHRRMGHPVINLGFAGNALFDRSVVELLGEIDAKAYVIDALPNSHMIKPTEVLVDTIAKAVRYLKSVRPDVPVLLVDHYGYPHGNTSKHWKGEERYANEANKAAYEKLLLEGVSQLYHLTYDDLGMTQDATVEGVHPSDYGMVLYADAYEKKLMAILNEPVGRYKTTIPIEQSRDFYNWMERHNQIIREGRAAKHFDRVVIGNSIMHQWGGVEGFPIQRGEKVWKKYMKGTLNMGCGWDRIENVLWRIYHGELDDFTADNIYMMIGTNNIGISSTEEILGGIEHLVSAIKVRRPEANLVLIGIFPRANGEEVVKKLNVGIENVARKMGVSFRDPGKAMLLENGKIDPTLFVDGLHPSAEGYAKIVEGFREKK